MIIVCPHCRKKHDIDEKRIPANVTMARCKGCGNRFPLQEAIEKPASPAPSAGGGARIGSSRRRICDFTGIGFSSATTPRISAMLVMFDP